MSLIFSRPVRLLRALGFGVTLLVAGAAQAQDPFQDGWLLQPESSALRFQSVKNNAVVEGSSFHTFTGAIDETGAAVVRIATDSVDTKIDLRNVRMRFLFLETFTFPEAVITVNLDPALLTDLAAKRRLTLSLPYTLELHGVTQDRVSDVIVTLMTDDMVSISSAGPIPLAVADFNLAEGITKLQEASGATILPFGSVTFDFVFIRNGTDGLGSGAAPVADIAAVQDAAITDASAALEAEGNFDAEACLGRFEILGRAGNINFRSASAVLDASSDALLDNLYDIVSRCPGMVLEVGGHTDSDGTDATNLDLSERRAGSVIDYLTAKGIAPDRLVAHGYGEAQPLLPNDSADNMRRNRRIQFTVISQ
jgi:OmpA-OmpF porin, OOP family